MVQGQSGKKHETLSDKLEAKGLVKWLICCVLPGKN
jgi:hypothetical protein